MSNFWFNVQVLGPFFGQSMRNNCSLIIGGDLGLPRRLRDLQKMFLFDYFNVYVTFKLLDSLEESGCLFCFLN